MYRGNLGHATYPKAKVPQLILGYAHSDYFHPESHVLYWKEKRRAKTDDETTCDEYEPFLLCDTVQKAR
jgi:hypothetical protein